MIKVLVVEDSPVVREFLIYILGSDPEIEIIGTAKNGKEAIEALRNKKPDIITMDIHMPEMDGYEATRRIMETQPLPIIIVSGSTSVGEVAMTFKAVEAGALSVVARPKGIGHPDYEATAKELIQTVKLMSEVKVVRRWPLSKKEAPPPAPGIEVRKALPAIQVVAIGASTGGPVALQTILSGLPRDFPVPVLIVQHITTGFLEGFAGWLGQSSSLPVHIASEDEYLLSGHTYLAPDGFHMVVKARNRIALSMAEPKDGLRPSVSHLFNSVARVFGQNAIGVLLTGMGKDGAQELKLMRDKGAVTIAQDEASSIVHGMPGEAIKISAATYVLSLERIAAVLASLVKGK
ncbi:chemotaxis-specific protein-glutamate methyltransferase CheB [Chloroflexota bacterium]